MDEQQIAETVRRYIVDEVLEGEEVGLDDTTPLLELGVLNSIEIGRLTRFVEREFGVRVPNDELVPGNFQDVQSIASFIGQLRQAA